jgi:predicted phage terminase large subunit-like protein
MSNLPQSSIERKAALELLRRRQARTNLYKFCEYVFPKFIPGKHIETICAELEKIESGENKRLIISCPPQHGKSTTACANFINWYLGRNPDHKVVLSSYSQSIAEMQARRTKDIFYSHRYFNLFQSAPNINSKYHKNMDKEFETASKGSVYAVGIGGSLTGRGYDLGILDDYVANRTEANSDATRRNIIEWWQSTFLTRQSPTAKIVIIATRWAQDDLIGTLHKDEPGIWKTVSLPAISNLNDVLWPERYSREKLDEIRMAIGSYEWSALYLGEPTIKGGNRFKTTSIKLHTDIKDFPNALYIRAWDLASSSKERNSSDPDYTVGMLGTIIRDKGVPHLWIKDMVCGRWEAPERDEIIKKTAIFDGPSVTQYVESYGPYKDAYTSLRKVLMGKNIVRNSILTGDKVVKASVLEPIFEAGNVHVLANPHIDMFIKQFSEFPFSHHDDFVDSASIIAHEHTKAKSGLLVMV